VQLAALNEVSKLRESRRRHGDEDEFRTHTMVRGQFLVRLRNCGYKDTGGPKNIERPRGRAAADRINDDIDRSRPAPMTRRLRR
jgi:hypothetical protein